jgi:hypothetical protein
MNPQDEAHPLRDAEAPRSVALRTLGNRERLHLTTPIRTIV